MLNWRGPALEATAQSALGGGVDLRKSEVGLAGLREHYRIREQPTMEQYQYFILVCDIFGIAHVV
jgi:hypothetical protein